MTDGPNEAFARRQAQWDSFHRWESCRNDVPSSVEERIAWYIAASRFSRAYSAQADPEQIQTKIKEIQKVRESLAHLRQVLRHG